MSLFFPLFFYVGHCCTAWCLSWGGGDALRRRCAFCFLEELRYDSKPWQSDAAEKNNNYFGYNSGSPNTGCSEWRWYRAPAFLHVRRKSGEAGVEMWAGVCRWKRGASDGWTCTWTCSFEINTQPNYVKGWIIWIIVPNPLRMNTQLCTCLQLLTAFASWYCRVCNWLEQQLN